MKTIFIILVIFFVIRLVMRMFGPYLLQRAARKMQEKMQQKMQDQQGFSQSEMRRREGEVKVEYPNGKPQNKQAKASGDDYVDYEIVD